MGLSDKRERILEQRIQYLEQKLDYVYRELEEEKKRVNVLEKKITIVPEMKIPLREISANSPADEKIKEDIGTEAETVIEVDRKADEPVYATSDSYDARDISSNYTMNYAWGKESSPKKVSDMEYKIGGSVFSFIGVLFLLVSFVTFGVYQLGSVGQGILLYAISVIVICISNLWFIKKNHRFGIAIMSLGFAGLYASTIINYLFLDNLTALTAIFITLLLAAGMLLYSHYKGETSLQVTSIWGCYISLSPLEQLESFSALLIPFAVAAIVTVMGCYLNYKKEKSAITICTLYGFGLFSCYLHFYGILSQLPSEWLVSTCILAILLSGGIYFTTKASSVCYPHYCIVSGIQLLITMIATERYIDSRMLLLVVAAFGILFWFVRANEGKWAVYIEGVILVHWLSLLTGDKNLFLLVFALILLLSKILACYEKVVNFDSILTWFAVLYCAIAYQDWQVILILAIMIGSLFFIRCRKTFYILPALTAIFLVMNLHICQLDLSAGILLVINQFVLALLTFVIAKISALRDDFTDLFVYGLLVMQMVILLPLLALETGYGPLLSACLIGVVSICFIQPGEVMGWQQKRLVSMIFLSIMVFTFPIETAVIVSGILMLLSIASIGIGFYCREKSVRVYGLVLSLIICAKTILYDFYSAELSTKISAFFVVGILILVISFVYFKLENSNRE